MEKENRVVAFRYRLYAIRGLQKHELSGKLQVVEELICESDDGLEIESWIKDYAREPICGFLVKTEVDTPHRMHWNSARERIPVYDGGRDGTGNKAGET